MASPQKKNRGRQKVTMTRMENNSNRQVTFSKRRFGLFKKASELCTLSGAEAAIIVFSPGRKPFSFGHPSVESIIKRFIDLSNPNLSSINEGHHPETLIEAHKNASIHELNSNLMVLNNQIAKEKKRSEEIRNEKVVNEEQQWWDRPVEELTIEQLLVLKASMEELKRNAIRFGNDNKVRGFEDSQYTLLGC